MMETTTETAKAKKAKATPARRGFAAKPPQVISEVHLIPLANIRVSKQVRTEFNEESIAELAADIEERGLRQPVEVTPIGDELYELTIGERRFRAIQKLGHKAIPAIITKTADEDRLMVQLAENIQREDLSLKDTIAAVRMLYDMLKKADAVALAVKKSKAWVSKHLAASFVDYCWHSKQLLMDGFEDLEKLGIVNQAFKRFGSSDAEHISNAVRQGCTREEARKLLKAAENDNADKKKAYEDRQKNLPGIEKVTDEVKLADPQPTACEPGEASSQVLTVTPGAEEKIQNNAVCKSIELTRIFGIPEKDDYPLLVFREKQNTWIVWATPNRRDETLAMDNSKLYRLPKAEGVV